MHVGNESGSHVASPTIAFELTWRERWVVLKLLHKQLLKAIWTAIHFLQPTERNGGDDGTRTRGLCRDSERLTSIFNDFESTDGDVSHWKYAVGEAIVYRDVYHDICWLKKALDLDVEASNR